MELPLFQFIVHNFMQAQLPSVTVFHCANFAASRFASIAHATSLLWQYVDLNDSLALERMEYRYFQHAHPVSGMFLDFNCPGTTLLINVISRYRFFSEHYHWLIYDSHARKLQFEEVFAHLNLSWNADVTFAQPWVGDESASQHFSHFRQYDVYSNGWHIGGKVNMTIDRELQCDAKRCQLSKYLSGLHLKRKIDNRANLHDITIRVSTVVTSRNISLPAEELLAFLQDIRAPHEDAIARMGFNMILLLRDMIGWNIQYIFMDRWGINETTGGTIGTITGEVTDLTSTAFIVTLERAKYVTPTTKMGIVRSVCMFRTPHNAAIKSRVFLEPFSATVWYYFALLLLFITVLLWCTFYVEHNRMPAYATAYTPSLLTSFMLTFGSVCEQGSYLLPQSNAGRMLFFTLSVFSFIMYNYYTSIVVSSLLGSPVRSKINTMSQLADSNLDVGMEPLPYTKTYLKNSQREDIRRFIKQKIDVRKDPNSVWLPAEQGILKMRDNPGFVYVFEATTGLNLIEKHYEPEEICDLNEILFRPETNLHTIVHKNQTFKELIRHSEIRLLETGVHFKHLNYWQRKNLNCLANNLVIDVGMEYAAPLFIILFIAYMAVLLILGLECAHQAIWNNVF